MPSLLPAGDPVPDDGSLPVSALAELSQRALSVYLHVPFCRTRCGYCDFNTYTATELGGMSPTEYLAAAHREIDLAAQVLGPNRPLIATIFVGGGTPTLLSPADLGALVQHLRQSWGLAEDCEITTEANPETVTPSYFEALREAGFTRISLGVQSVIPHVLRTLERSHTPGRGIEAAHWARAAGFRHISVDLIYGTPGESSSDWCQSLAAAIEAPVNHVSAYSLIVEEGTRLALRVRKGEVPLPDEDELAEKYLVAEELLTAGGMTNYETSNWARAGGQCRHNLAYWRGDNWWGIGPGAHSHIGGVRFWNRKHPRSYAARLAQGLSPAQGQEILTAQQRRHERILLELRLAEGLDTAVLTGPEQQRAAEIVAEGLAHIQDDHLVLTLRGRLLADGIVLRLLG